MQLPESPTEGGSQSCPVCPWPWAATNRTGTDTSKCVPESHVSALLTEASPFGFRDTNFPRPARVLGHTPTEPKDFSTHGRGRGKKTTLTHGLDPSENGPWAGAPSIHPSPPVHRSSTRTTDTLPRRVAPSHPADSGTRDRPMGSAPASTWGRSWSGRSDRQHPPFTVSNRHPASCPGAGLHLLPFWEFLSLIGGGCVV